MNDLVKAGAALGEMSIGQTFQRMRRATAAAPIEGLRLVTEDVARFTRFPTSSRADRHGERVVSIIFGGGHREPNDQRGPLVENGR